LGALKGKSVLDVGAGGGEFLSAIRWAGAEVIASEISAEACGFLENRLSIPVVRGDLCEAAWRFRSPDVIVMSDLIEHPIEPLRLLSRCVELLHEDGLLVIWTPNGGAAGRDLTAAEKWVGFRVDLEHLQYFSARTIQVMATTFGLHIEHLESTGYPGISGIDQLPCKTKSSHIARLIARLKSLTRSAAPLIPQIRQLAREARRPRVRGNYHLFAILRKS
jgi:SAM-dependent methyltransferase